MTNHHLSAARTDAPPATEPPQAEPEPATTCGEFGPMPPRPDSMLTNYIDTNGDGEDDAVTAYAGGGNGWVLRVVEDGVISEAVIPDVAGMAGIAGSIDAGDRQHVLVSDWSSGAFHTFATDTGCIEFLSTRAVR